MKTLRILVGPPGSGKSTFAQDMIENDGDIGAMVTRISQDDQGRKGHMDAFERAIKNGDNIIVDRMNFSKEQRNRYLIPAKKAGYRTEIIVFHVPYATCLERCMKREKHPTINGSVAWKGVGTGTRSQETNDMILKQVEIEKKKQAQSALHTFFTKYERVGDLEADSVKRLGWENKNGWAIICDLDGTLCNIDHRLHHVKGDKKNWKDFFAEMDKDKVNDWCAETLHSMGDFYQIVLCSGRPEDYKDKTVKWLEENGVEWNSLLMRQRNDFRQDDIVKEIILEFEIKPRWDILMAIDDRQQVVEMWRKHGITCLQCAKGDF